MDLEKFIEIGKRLHEGRGDLERAQQVNYFSGSETAESVSDSGGQSQEMKYMEMLKWAYQVGNKRLQREILKEMLARVGEEGENAPAG